jgi:hypothetical protein
MTDLEKIESCENILATRIFEPDTNELVVEISLGRVSDIEEDWIINEKNLGKRREVLFDNIDDSYCLYFGSYISYFIVNESYDNLSPGNHSGNRIREYKTSAFIDFCKKETLGFQILNPEDVRQYEIVTVNHIILILTTCELEIRTKE